MEGETKTVNNSAYKTHVEKLIFKLGPPKTIVSAASPFTKALTSNTTIDTSSQWAKL